jgi:hypothetical protein
VINPYGELGLVSIVNSADELVVQARQLMQLQNKTEWLKRVDDHLINNSWDRTFDAMHELLQGILDERKFTKQSVESTHL